MTSVPDDFIPTRRSLLSRLKNWDDQESWREFFDTYWKLIYGVALKSGLTGTEAEDALQDTVISVAKKLPGFKYNPAIGSFKSWLLLITRRRIADHLRKRGRDPLAGGRAREATSGTSMLERIPDPTSVDLDAVWEAEWERHVMDAAISRVKQRVDPKQFQIFDGYVLKRWPVQKVSQMLGVSPSQVYLAKHRISAALKAEIRRLENTMT